MEQTPKLTAKQYQRAVSLLHQQDVMEAVNEINDQYLYWSDVKYRKCPPKVTADDLWSIVKVTRRMQSVSIWPTYKIHTAITNRMHRLCHYFDMNFGGSWGNESIVPSEGKEQYLISSLMEEAISSSQMEGAATTRRVAKEMLRKNISPKNRSDQMIINNYQCIRFITEHKNNPLSEGLLLQIHQLMTHKTLQDRSLEGAFRDNDDVVVENGVTHEIVHTPPSHEEIPMFVSELCSFVNNDNEGDFIHPIIRAVIVHFMIAFVHPFADGNGRTARALFYWYMLKNGYWLMEFLSISRVIYRSKASYENAYLFTEADGNDMGYFINYHLDVLERAFKELKQYLQAKVLRRQKNMDMMRAGQINERQAVLLSLLRDNPKMIFTVKEVQNRFGISDPTARLDLEQLVSKRFLEKISANQVKANYMKGEAFDQLLSNV